MEPLPPAPMHSALTVVTPGGTVQLLPEVRIELVGVAVGVAVTVGVAVAVAVGVAVLVAVAVAVAVGVPQELTTRAPAALAVSLNSSSPCTVKLWDPVVVMPQVVV